MGEIVKEIAKQDALLGAVIVPLNPEKAGRHILKRPEGRNAFYDWDPTTRGWYRATDKMHLRYDPLKMSEVGFQYLCPAEGVDGTVAADPEAFEPVMINVRGQPVKRRHVAERVQLEDQLVRDLIAKADATRTMIADFKATAMADVGAFLELLAERYNAKRGGRRDGTRLTSYDGLLRVEISVADTLTLGAELSAAKDLIDQCITRWSSGANEHLTAIVNAAFAVGEGGNVRVDRIIELRRLEIDDDTWREAMRAIGDALRVQQSRSYIRFYRRRNADARFEQITLDLSRV